MWPPADPPKPLVHEREPQDKPILYGPDGSPLVVATPRVGFVMPRPAPGAPGSGGEKK